MNEILKSVFPKATRTLIYRLRNYILGRIRVSRDFSTLKSQSSLSKWSELFPFDRKSLVLDDFYDLAGIAAGHYFHQDIFVAREILKAQPRRHFDFGSRIDGFISHLAVFREVDVFDIRSLETTEQNIRFHQLDIMDTSQVVKLEQVESLSCLHTAEHFGLGRYGDPIDFDGWEKGINNLTSLLVKGGILYFSTPVSHEQRIVFNAHRIFQPKFLNEFFSDNFEILKTAMIEDSGQMNLSADFTSEEFLSNFRGKYSCGIWVLRKK